MRSLSKVVNISAVAEASGVRQRNGRPTAIAHTRRSTCSGNHTVARISSAFAIAAAEEYAGCETSEYP